VIDPDETGATPLWLRGPTAHDQEDDAFWEAETRTDRDPVGVWRGLIAEAERRGDQAGAERLRAGGPPPEPGPSPMVFAPLIAALEIGDDPGGAVAVALAAVEIEWLRLVVVAGGAEAARYTRQLLDLIGRPEVAVVAGRVGHAGAIAGLVATDVPDQPTDVFAAVRDVTASTPYAIRWANAGPLTDLAAVLRDDPDLVRRLDCSIVAAPLDGRQPQFAADVDSAAFVLTTLRQPDIGSHDPQAAIRAPFHPTLITASADGHTVAAHSSLQRRLEAPDAPAWCRLLAAHMDQWFATGKESDMSKESGVGTEHGRWTLTPALAVAESRRLPYLDSAPATVALTPSGELVEDPAGQTFRITRGVRDYLFAFAPWLEATLAKAAARGD
jgi:hypothetical protein